MVARRGNGAHGDRAPMNWRSGRPRLPCAPGSAPEPGTRMTSLGEVADGGIAHDGLGRSAPTARRAGAASTSSRPSPPRLMITASTAARRARAGARRQRAGARSARRQRRRQPVAPGRETVIGAYTGAPYNYPSAARVRAARAPSTSPSIPSTGTPTRSRARSTTARACSAGSPAARPAAWSTSSTRRRSPRSRRRPTSPAPSTAQPLPPRARIADVVSKLEFSHGHNMLLFNGLVRLPGIGARVSPYAGAGVGALAAAHRVPADQRQPPAHLRIQLRRPRCAGAARRRDPPRARVVLRRVQVHLRRTTRRRCRQMDGSWLPLDIWRQVKRWFAGEPPPGGHISTRARRHQVVSGLAVRLASPAN